MGGWSKALGWKKGAYREQAGPGWSFIAVAAGVVAAVNARLEKQLPIHKGKSSPSVLLGLQKVILGTGEGCSASGPVQHSQYCNNWK